MEDILPSDYFVHFFLYVCGFSICLKKITKTELKFAQEIMNEFVFLVNKHYDNTYNTLTTHLLQHTISVIKTIGSLADVNAYIFEDANGTLASYVKSNTNLAKQIALKNQMLFEVSINLLESESTIRKLEPSLRNRRKLDEKFTNLCKTIFDKNIQFQYEVYKDPNSSIYLTSTKYATNTKHIDFFVKASDGCFYLIHGFIQEDSKVFAIVQRTKEIDNLFVEQESLTPSFSNTPTQS